MSQITPDETLLGLLAARPHQHGYQLLECFRRPDQLGRVWNLSTSQLYAVLKRLDNQGFVTGHIVEKADTPPRIEYTLTGAGRARLEAWLHDPCPSASVRRVRVEFLSRLFVASLLGLPTAPVIERQKLACQEKLAALAVQPGQAQPGIGSLALELVIAQMEAIVQWIDQCELSLCDKENG
jgi:DNA-binding PadR family transcriptional regulator